MLRPYLQVLQAPGAAKPFFNGFLGSLAISMHSLAVLLLVRETTGSFAQAGAIAAALSAGGAVGLIVQGRLVDRYGQGVILIPAGAICGCSLALLAPLATTHSSAWAMGCLATMAGVSIPAVPSAMRVLWPDLLPAFDARTTAYALHSVQHQTSTIVGPLVVAGALLVAGPAAAVLITAALAAGAAIGFAATSASRRWRPTRVARGWKLRSVTHRGVRTLLVTSLGVGGVGGFVSVGVSAVAVDHGAASLAGVLLAGYSVGGIVGGLIYGSLSRRTSRHTHLALALVGEAVVLATLSVTAVSLVSLHPLAVVPLLVGAGAIGAPITIAASTLLDTVVTKESLTESYTALIATGLLGMAGGSYVAGSLGELVGENAIFAAAALTFVMAALWTWSRRRTLEGQPS